MTDNVKTIHEPLLHIVKRDSISTTKKIIIYAVAILSSLLLGAIICSLVSPRGNIGKFFSALFEGSFGTERLRWGFLQEFALLLAVSMALIVSFKMKFWNLGANGQILMGGLASIACSFYLGGKINETLLIILCVLSSAIAGAIWAVIPAIFKAKWNTNETLFTLMMNYVATQIVAYFIIIWEKPKGSGKIGIINQQTQAGWLPEIGGKQYMLIVIVSLIMTVFMYIYLRYSKHGYELTVVGESQNTARYVGINVGKVIVRTLILCGLICGLTGWLLVAGTDHTMTTTIEGGKGFLGVMVAWLAQFNPVAMVLSSLLLAFLSRGASEISAIYQLNHSFGDIITGIIIFFIIGSEFFINYKLHFRKSSGKEEA
jgi:simple sugar transport system permease protein